MKHFFRKMLSHYRLKRMGVLNKGPSVSESKPGLFQWFRNPAFSVGLFLVVLLSAVLFSLQVHPEQLEVPELMEGMHSYVSVQSQIHFRYVDEKATKQAQKAAALSVPFCYRLRSSRLQDLLKEYDRFIWDLRTLLKKKTEAFGTAEKKLSLSTHELDSLKPAAEDVRMENHIRRLLTRAAEDGYLSTAESRKDLSEPVSIVDDEGRKLRNRYLTRGRFPASRLTALYVAEEAAYRFLPERERQDFIRAFTSVMTGILDRHALEPDPDLTNQLRKTAADSVAPIMKDVMPGEMLLRRNDSVTAPVLQILKAYRIALQEQDQAGVLILSLLRNLIGAILIVFFAFLLFLQICPEILSDSRKLWLMGGIIIIGILFNMACQKFFSIGSRELSIQPWLFFMALPLGFVSMTLAPLLGSRAALPSGLIVISVASFSSPEQSNIMAAGLLTAAIVAFTVRSSMNYRSYLVTGFLTLFLTNLFCGFILAWSWGIRFAEFDKWLFLVPLFSAFGSTVLSQVVLYFIDYCFSCTTNMSLHILLDGDHPLLRRLQFEAPGTYHHSLMVSLLAESAAREIGADGLLARVESLFHDVGKLYQPGYFTENGLSEDRYDDLTPNASALFIIKHVKAGMELAREYKLKRPLRDAIEQHHGTDLVYYFYRKAQESGQPVDETCFRYKGPLPQTREIAVVSLADACEAASRSLEKPTHSKIKELVDSIVSARLRSGQLDDSGLTLSETAQIRECFTRVLTSMLHARVAYPKEEEEK